MAPVAGLAGAAGGLVSSAGGLVSGILPVLGPLGQVAGPLMSMFGGREEDKQAQRIAEYRAQIQLKNAELAKRYSVEKAKILEEKKIRFQAMQIGKIAAGNIRTNVGEPLVIETQTEADFWKEKSFTLERGREEVSYYESLAALERLYGKKKKKESKWDLLTQGLGLFGNEGFMGGLGSLASMGAGLFGGGSSFEKTALQMGNAWMSPEALY